MASISEEGKAESEESVVFAVVAARENVKAIKSHLAARGLFGKSISRLNDDTTSTTSFRISTTIPFDPTTPPPPELAGYELTTAPSATSSQHPADPFQAFLHTHVADKTLLATAPKRTSIYPPLLLLQSDAFASAGWRGYLSSHPDFLARLAAALKVTHIARNAPITASDVMRSPSGLEFLFPPSSASAPSTTFDDALWVSTTQHGLYQTWAPEHTMFSRGNIREKARVLSFAGVSGEEVADLYAGIGYFVFPYLRAGARRVWCWEINPWSVEALRRGCVRNGWSVRVVPHSEEFGQDTGEQVVVFAEGNENAVRRMEAAERLRRMAHVNLGLLPSSKASWSTAEQLVKTGGLVHVHENVGEHEVAAKTVEFVQSWSDIAAAAGKRDMKCEHVERVKTFAPGVLHCVFDIRVGESS
ncbi:S-adenosyl-L-methionine-dependent methyltransferase [Sphaerosporella brunnea]|uniref:tRNA wybutosine-synthesizing protein 2 n=1 Tax=Sphaerosporella brunnea TaxID=1250544 RepID=A0A5J5ERT1_9PEZI|nr:S-adenosyl-L-methionine-dependent methyltransferase [Sphaerosporella brunnea]